MVGNNSLNKALFDHSWLIFFYLGDILLCFVILTFRLNLFSILQLFFIEFSCHYCPKLSVLFVFWVNFITYQSAILKFDIKPEQLAFSLRCMWPKFSWKFFSTFGDGDNLSDISSFLINDLNEEIGVLNLDCPKEKHIMLPNNSPLKTLHSLRIKGVVAGEGGKSSKVLQRNFVDPFDEFNLFAVNHYTIGVFDIDVLEWRGYIVNCFAFYFIYTYWLLFFHLILDLSKTQLILPQGNHINYWSFSLNI